MQTRFHRFAKISTEQEEIAQIDQEIKQIISDSSKRSVRPSAFLNQLDLLPVIQEFQNQRNGAISNRWQERRHQLPKLSEFSAVSPQVANTARIKLASNKSQQNIFQAPLQLITRAHRPTRSLANSELIELKPLPKKVMFNDSTQVVDIDNGLVTEGNIHDSPTKLHHKRFRSNMQIQTTLEQQ